jgi:mevalonate kinase
MIWQASAPGKVILFGEHAVVYHRPAIAVPVGDVRARVTLALANREDSFKIVAPDLDREYDLRQAAADDPLATVIRLTLHHLQQTNLPAATLTVNSSIPLGRGLGSGAAISTAIARVLGQYFGKSLPPAEISNLVYEVEKIYHGTPSGIDNTVIAFEQPVYFIKGRPIQRLGVGQSFTLVIGDTGRVATTHQVVGDLRQRWQAEPERYEGYFDEIGAIAVQARLAIEQELFPLETIGKLMDQNQELLERIGVSSPELERLVGAARQAGALGAKLSGAGWGGNMIALVRPESTATVAQALSQAGATGVIVTEVRPTTGRS